MEEKKLNRKQKQIDRQIEKQKRELATIKILDMQNTFELKDGVMAQMIGISLSRYNHVKNKKKYYLFTEENLISLNKAWCEKVKKDNEF